MIQHDNQELKIMVVDDTPANVELLEEILVSDGYGVLSYTKGSRALQAAVRANPDLILLDVMMPEMSGLELCERLKADVRTESIPVIFLSALSDTEDKVKGFAAGGVDYITKPFHAQEVTVRVRTHIALNSMRKKLQEYNDHLQDLVQAQIKEIHESQLATISVLSTLSECRDGITGKHIQRTSLFCRELAVVLQRDSVYAGEISDMFIYDIFHAAPLHDIGKIGIPDSILMKPGKLTAEEFEIMKTHSTIGAENLQKVQALYPNNSFINMGVNLARSHHEKWNGTGYPQGLSGEQIPLCGRIMALVDVYDAVSSKRPYKEASTHEQTVEIIRQGSGTHFDPVIVQAFLSIESTFATIRMEYEDIDKQEAFR